MKKNLLVLSLLVMLSGCNSSNDSEVTALEEKVEALTIENQMLQEMLAEKEASSATTEESEEVTVLLTGKSTTVDKYNVSYVDLVFSVENKTDNAIKGVQGLAVFKDIFGVEIKKVRCDFTGTTINAHDSIVVSTLSFECNRFIDSDMKFFNTKFDDIIFEYQVTAIVYENDL